ncbi:MULTISPECIES: hypothetical protein [unclassified Chryseobacterium]|uniref:hypothetical protein n=1 Tax=unclassified Chryseobacterium TaxID=2593645 RepID=UPI001166F0D8|nr:hypothetical protein [Chryseobacterium sp. ON_d1]GEJ43752.1 hypothetical protein CRS_03600 [Chryseobacterium sp. ON_d1]
MGSTNNLDTFPEALMEIPVLEEINLQGNQVNDLGNLSFPENLKYLELQQNAIIRLSENLFKSRRPEFLNVNGNHITEYHPK